MMLSFGFRARACSTTCPASNASGMATSRQRALPILAAPITSGSAALPAMVSIPPLHQLGEPILNGFDDEERHVLLCKSLADNAADPAVADQHHVI
jgi:hypothetical protein